MTQQEINAEFRHGMDEDRATFARTGHPADTHVCCPACDGQGGIEDTDPYVGTDWWDCRECAGSGLVLAGESPGWLGSARW